MKAHIVELLNQQKDIQEKIRLLLQEENEITQNIERLMNRHTEQEISAKSKLKNQIKQMGFQLSSNKINNIRTLQLSKDDQSMQLIITQSSWHEGHHNAWYTLKPNVEKVADYIIFIYTDIAGVTSYIMLDNPTLNSLIQRVQKMPDGRINIKLKADNSNAFEIQSKIDLSSNIGNIDIFSDKFRR